MKEDLTIGRLAKAAGVSVETVRYYQRRGLLEEPRKPLGGQRRYSAKALERLRFIRRAQQLGFSLEEVKTLLALSVTRDYGEMCTLCERKCERLELWIAQLQATLKSLRDLVTRSRRSRDPKASPIFDFLSGPDQAPRF